MGFLDTLFGGGAEREAADKNRAELAQYQTKGLGALDSGLTNSKTALDNAGGIYSGLQNKYGAGSSLYLDALGVNGGDKAQAAQSNFTTNPGYQQGIDAGIDVLNRRRASGGMLDSGNADLDALTYGQNQQNQQYNGWLDRLGGLVNPEMTAASGAAGNQTNLANLYQGDATNRIGLYGNVASGNIGANNYQAAGEAAGAKNALGGALSLATLGTSLAGGGGLGSMFGGGGKQSSMSYGGQSWPMFK
jgi:hypothetical protein